MRSQARENAVLLIYENLIQKSSDGITMDIYMKDPKLNDQDKEFMNSLYNGVLENQSELSEIIQKHSIDFPINRIFKVDLAVLLAATYELKHIDTPVPVIINEAVNLSSKYGTDKSAGYVNGMLANISKEIRQ